MTDRTLIVEYKTGRPMEAAEFAASLAALGDQFKRFVAEENGIDSEARLFIHEIRPGSTVAEFFAMGKAVGDLYDAMDKLGPFVPTLYEILQLILHLPPKAKDLDKATVKNASAFVSPIAAQTVGQMNLIDNRGGTIIQQYTVTPMEASAIRHNAQHLLNSQFPEEIRFENEPMTLFQMRNAPPGKTGDFGIIDRFSPSERKLTFAGDAVKDAILHHDGNPFGQTFWINGVVKTVGGKVAGYHVTRLNDATATDVA